MSAAAQMLDVGGTRRESSSALAWHMQVTITTSQGAILKARKDVFPHAVKRKRLW
jgi:hypothetical protein